jgi:hypothetical protein
MSILCGLTDVTNWRTAVVPVRITPGRVVPLGGTLNGETALPGKNFFNVVLPFKIKPLRTLRLKPTSDRGDTVPPFCYDVALKAALDA